MVRSEVANSADLGGQPSWKILLKRFLLSKGLHPDLARPKEIMGMLHPISVGLSKRMICPQNIF